MQKILTTACAIVALGTTACDPASADASTTGADKAAISPAAAATPDTAPAKVAAAPKPAEGYDWAMRIDEEDRTRPAILAYEMNDTDAQPLHFSCEEGGARIFAGIDDGPDSLSAITLTSGDQTLEIGGKTGHAEMPTFTSNEIAGSSPFFNAFAANGWLRMTADGKTTDMAGTSVGAKAVTEFVTHCNRPYSEQG